MEFLELAKNRYSLRSYSTKKIEKEKMEKILSAARIAPTGKNMQEQRIIVVESDEALEKIKKCTKCHWDAPTVLIICYDKTESGKVERYGYDCGIIDMGIVAAHMALEATDLGLGTCMVGYFDPEITRKEFNIPNGYGIALMLTVGYPAKDAECNLRHLERKDLSKTVFYNSL